MKYHDKTYFYDKLASRKEWEDFANKYETSRRLTLIFDRLLDRTEMEGKWFLDVGSGGGHFSHAARCLEAKVVSLDVGLNLLKQVGNKCDSKKVVGSVLGLPFGKNCFDIVICTEVIEHTPNPLNAIKELSTVVKPGGTIIITIPCRLWNPIVKLATVLKFRPYEGYENFLWPEELRQALVGQGITLEILTGFNFCPIFSKKLDWLFKFFDKLYGKKISWLMCNIAVKGQKNL